MKKIINTAFTYGVLALIGGVVFREVTRFAHFTEETTLSVIHTHLFAMGMLVFLIAASLEKQFKLTAHKHFNLFYLTYNIGLSIAVLGFLVRGLFQVYHVELSHGLNSALSGVIGLGHVIWTVGIVTFLLIVKKQALQEK